MSAEQIRKLVVLAAIWAALLLAPYWMVPLGGYTALATRVLGARTGGDVGQFPAGIYRRAVVFGHAAYFGLGAYGAGLTLKFLAASTPLALVLGMLLGGLCGAILGTLIVRRRGVYFAMVTIAFGQWCFITSPSSVEFADRRRRRLAWLLASADRFRPVQARHSLQRRQLLLLCVVLLCACGRRHGIYSALAVRPHHDRNSRERAPRPLPRYPRRAAYLDRVYAVLFLHGVCWRALCALVNNFADPRGLHYSQSGDFVMMAVMGGMRSFWGPLLGAAVFVVLQDYLSSITVNWMSFVGLAFCASGVVLPARTAGLPLQREQAHEIVLEINKCHQAVLAI